jgi:hypothetical protein
MMPPTSKPSRDKEPNIIVRHMAGFPMPLIPNKLRLTTGVSKAIVEPLPI